MDKMVYINLNMMLDGYTIRFVFGFSKNGMRRFSTAGLLTPDHLRYYDELISTLKHFTCFGKP
jgi:hypothetical protein